MKAFRWTLIFLLLGNVTAKADMKIADRLYAQKYYADAFDEYVTEAKNNNAKAQAKLGLMYFWGRGVFRDDSKSFQWSLAGAKQGNADAQHMLGYLYENALAVPRDMNQAVFWYQKAADQNHIEAAANLANIYIHGIGVARNSVKGFQLAKIAADKNNRFGQYLLGMAYQNIFQDFTLAKHWLEKAAQQGSAEAANQLGMIYFDGVAERTDLVQALFWFLIAEEYNSAEAFQNRVKTQGRVTKENLLRVQSDVKFWLERYLQPKTVYLLFSPNLIAFRPSTQKNVLAGHRYWA